jgi:excisionase family DNA binding protein
MRQQDYCTVAEAAAILGIPERTIAYRLSRGMMQGERAGARLWLIPRAEVERWRGRGKLPSGPKRRVAT